MSVCAVPRGTAVKTRTATKTEISEREMVRYMVLSSYLNGRGVCVFFSGLACRSGQAGPPGPVNRETKASGTVLKA